MGLSLTQTEHGLSGPSPSPDSGTQTTTTRARARARASVSSSTSIWGFAFFSSSLLNVPWLRFCPSLGGMQPRVPSSLHQCVNSHTSQAFAPCVAASDNSKVEKKNIGITLKCSGCKCRLAIVMPG
ncbi:hypothetical protein GBA52_018873 [Prunus armeniaca]|nr:hypothetical protein GBA52_018873 [Prunus armeniaca]